MLHTPTDADQYFLNGCGRCALGGTPKCKVIRWNAELKRLRELVLSTELKEERKWGVACYTLNKKNVVIIHAFKEYCALLFFKGALMDDPKNILIQQTENVQSGRQIRFSHITEISTFESVLIEYLEQAIRIEKSGLKVAPKKTEDFNVPEELQQILAQKPDLKSAFEALTPGRQRGYLLYFSAAKQSKTRIARIEKFIPDILSGKGIND